MNNVSGGRQTGTCRSGTKKVNVEMKLKLEVKFMIENF